MAYTVTYSDSSLYAKTPIIGDRFLDFYRPVLIAPDPTDKLFIIKRYDWVHRPDLMAHDYYGNDMLFWVFGVRNGLKDLVFDINMGSVLWFPDRNRLAELGIGGNHR